MARAGGSFDAVDVDVFDRLHGEGVLGGIVYGWYAEGLKHFMHRAAPGARRGADAVFAEPPASTEQWLHPTKRGRDHPTAIVLPMEGPADGWRKVGQDTLGELGIRNWLLLREALPRARRAACGWDGDMVAIYEHPTKGAFAVWVTVWDRDDDAQRFHYAASEVSPAWFSRKDRVVILVSARDRFTEDIVTWAHEALDVPEAVAADAASTAAIETGWGESKDDPAIEGGWWRLPRLGLEMPVADGWFQELHVGQTMLRATSPLEYGWPDISIRLAMLGRPLDLGQAKGRFDALSQGTFGERVIQHERVTLHGGREALLVEHAVSDGPVWLPVRYLTLYVPTPWGALVVRGCVHHDEHDERMPQIRATLKALRYNPPGR